MNYGLTDKSGRESIESKHVFYYRDKDALHHIYTILLYLWVSILQVVIVYHMQLDIDIKFQETKKTRL